MLSNGFRPTREHNKPFRLPENDDFLKIVIKCFVGLVYESNVFRKLFGSHKTRKRFKRTGKFLVFYAVLTLFFLPKAIGFSRLILAKQCEKSTKISENPCLLITCRSIWRISGTVKLEIIKLMAKMFCRRKMVNTPLLDPLKGKKTHMGGNFEAISAKTTSGMY